MSARGAPYANPYYLDDLIYVPVYAYSPQVYSSYAQWPQYSNSTYGYISALQAQPSRAQVTHASQARARIPTSVQAPHGHRHLSRSHIQQAHQHRHRATQTSQARANALPSRRASHGIHEALHAYAQRFGNGAINHQASRGARSRSQAHAQNVDTRARAQGGEIAMDIQELREILGYILDELSQLSLYSDRETRRVTRSFIPSDGPSRSNNPPDAGSSVEEVPASEAAKMPLPSEATEATPVTETADSGSAAEEGTEQVPALEVTEPASADGTTAEPAVVETSERRSARPEADKPQEA